MDQLVEFWHKFGGSARDAYKNAFQLADYQSSLEHLAKGLTIKSLDRACTPNPSAAQAYPHRLLSVFPLSDDDRTQSNIRPPTPHIMEIIVQALSRSPEKTQVDFFDSLVTSYNIAQRTLAAYFYDRYFHEYITRGEVLKCFAMKPPQTARVPDQQTRIWISGTGTTKAKSFSLPYSIMPCRFDPNLISELVVGCYYIPDDRSFLTLDSFLVHSSTHAVAFQATITSKHGITDQGLNWLRVHRIETIEYFHVSPSSTKTASIMFPASIPDSLDYPDLDEYPETLIGNSVAKTSAEELTIDAIEDTVDDSCAVKIIGIYHLHLDFTLYGIPSLIFTELLLIVISQEKPKTHEEEESPICASAQYQEVKDIIDRKQLGPLCRSSPLAGLAMFFVFHILFYAGPRSLLQSRYVFAKRVLFVFHILVLFLINLSVRYSCCL